MFKKFKRASKLIFWLIFYHWTPLLQSQSILLVGQLFVIHQKCFIAASSVLSLSFSQAAQYNINNYNPHKTNQSYKNIIMEFSHDNPNPIIKNIPPTTSTIHTSIHTEQGMFSYDSWGSHLVTVVLARPSWTSGPSTTGRH